jgi:hypothetical protein
VPYYVYCIKQLHGELFKSLHHPSLLPTRWYKKSCHHLSLSILEPPTHHVMQLLHYKGGGEGGRGGGGKRHAYKHLQLSAS